MNIICTLISIILLTGFIILVYSMQNNTLVSQIENFPELNSVVYSIMLGVLAFLSGFMFSQRNIENVKKESTKQLRKAEKAGIDTKESLDKINRLNSKIETLEVALKEALKNKEN